LSNAEQRDNWLNSSHRTLAADTEGEETEIQRSKEKGKQKEERLDGEDKEEEAEIGGQEEDNQMEGVKEESSRFSPAAYSVGTGSC